LKRLYITTYNSPTSLGRTTTPLGDSEMSNIEGPSAYNFACIDLLFNLNRLINVSKVFFITSLV